MIPANMSISIETDLSSMMKWHTNQDEFQNQIKGEVKMTIFLPNQKVRTFNYCAGDVGYHYI